MFAPKLLKDMIILTILQEVDRKTIDVHFSMTLINATKGKWRKQLKKQLQN